MNESNLENQVPPVEPQGPKSPALNKGLVVGLSIVLTIALAAVAYLMFARPAAAPTGPRGGHAENTAVVLPDGRLNILSPREGDVVGVKFNLEGYAQGWFEGNVPVKVVDALDNVLYNAPFTLAADNYGTPAQFSAVVALTKRPVAGVGRILITDYSAKDGSVVYQKVVNIRFNSDIVGAEETADWKTYSSERYGFEVKYPSSVKVVGTMSPNSVLGTYQVPVPGVHIGSLVFVIRQTNADRQAAESYINSYLETVGKPIQNPEDLLSVVKGK